MLANALQDGEPETIAACIEQRVYFEDNADFCSHATAVILPPKPQHVFVFDTSQRNLCQDALHDFACFVRALTVVWVILEVDIVV